MTRTIDVTGTYVVGSADDLRFLGEPAFRFMAGETPPQLICAGSVSASGHSVDMFGVVTDDDASGAAGARVTLKESADFRVHSMEQGATGFLLTMDDVRFSNAGAVRIAGATFAIGLQMEGQDVAVANSGRLEVASRTATTGATLGASSHLTNTGDFIVSAATFGANGVIMYGGSLFENSGLLQVKAELGAFGVQMSPGGEVRNDGNMLIVSRSGDATGVSFWDAGVLHNGGDIMVSAAGPATGVALQGSGDVFNDGTIVANSIDDAIRSAGISAFDGELIIRNDGTIRADDAILVQFSQTGAEVVNTGKILGDVTLGDGADHLFNLHAVIRGHVELGGGNDTFSGATGKLAGDVSGGDGNDLLVLGRSDDVIAGDAGADTLAGGGGSDIFVFASASDSHDATADVITDLSAGDSIDLSAIDADAATDGDQAFHLVSAFHGAAGELMVSFNAKHGWTLVRGDVDGDGHADLRIVLTGDHSDFAGFVL